MPAHDWRLSKTKDNICTKCIKRFRKPAQLTFIFYFWKIRQKSAVKITDNAYKIMQHPNLHYKNSISNILILKHDKINDGCDV